jgi:hypothetical protein
LQETLSFEKVINARYWWLTTVIPATQEAEIRRIAVQNQPRQIVKETLSQKKQSQKRAGGMAQGVGPEFKHSTAKKKRKEKEKVIKILGRKFKF